MLGQHAIGDEVVTNYRSGIDVTFGGQAGEDWTQEHFYHDPLVDDSKVVYIKSSTPIFMAHNDRNKRQTNISNPTEKIIGRDGEDGIPDSGDEGIIRYRVDEDLYVNTSKGFSRVYWSQANAEDSHTRYKAYTGPLTFASLTYRDGTPVVGSVGPNQEDITDRGNAYWYGVLDEFGDEWHTFAYADDDEFLIESPDGPFTSAHYEKLASDGKILLFVVNPKTPCIRFTAQEGGQFYTTPPKAYNIPVVHPQTTYLSGNVTVTLTNIADDAPCYFRFYTGAPSGQYTRYTAQAMADGVAALMDGVPYTLEYYCDPEHKKKRTIVRNPGYPSAGESHGYMLWSNDDEFEAIKGRLTRDRYLYWYNLLKSRGEVGRNETTYWDSISRQGHRIASSAAIINAFIAAVEGWDYVVPGTAKSYALYAKEMLLENVLNLDPLWFGDETATPNPSHELLHRGYYDVRPVMSAALAYDLLIAHFRADQHSGGITPIEDYKIRDMLAKWNIMAMMEVGRFGYYGHTAGAQGMWATARGYGALINAVAMPSYDTPYFGTSGFDDKAATHPWTPYRDYPKSWKNVFFSPSETSPDELVGFPNMALRADWARRVSSTCPLIIEEAGEINGFSVVMGDWADRGEYLQSLNYGMPLTLFANVLKISQGKTYPHIERLFERVADGVAISAHDGATIRHPYLLLVNEHFAGTGPAYEDSVAAKHEAYMASFPEGHASTIDRQMTLGIYGVYSLVLYHDDWRQYVKADSARHTADGLKGRWLLNEYSGFSAQETAGKASAGMRVKGPCWVGTGQLRLDGVNDMVDCGAGAHLNQKSSLTLCAWICPETFGLRGDARIVDKGNESAGFAFYLKGGIRGLAWKAGNAEVTSAEDAIRLNEWQHVAVSYSDASDTVTFYVNGKAKGTVTGYTTNPADSADVPLIIGNNAALAAGFKGMISDVRLYSRALTAEEIDLIYRTYEVRENKLVAFEVAADGYTYALQAGQTLPAGATFADGVFSWRPWYNQAGNYTFHFDVAGQAGLTQSIPVVVENVILNDWYRIWLDLLGK